MENEADRMGVLFVSVLKRSRANENSKNWVNQVKGMSLRSARYARRIAELLHGPVRCSYCGRPAHTVAIDLESRRAEVHCQKCGTFETPSRELKLFQR